MDMYIYIHVYIYIYTHTYTYILDLQNPKNCCLLRLFPNFRVMAQKKCDLVLFAKANASDLLRFDDGQMGMTA